MREIGLIRLSESELQQVHSGHMSPFEARQFASRKNAEAKQRRARADRDHATHLRELAEGASSAREFAQRRGSSTPTAPPHGAPRQEGHSWADVYDELNATHFGRRPSAQAQTTHAAGLQRRPRTFADIGRECYEPATTASEMIAASSRGGAR